MTQPYGQQPGDQGQPGGQYPGGGGVQQPGGQQYPGGGGFPQAPQAPGYQQGYGGMPAAPQEYGGGPVARPGGTTAAAVLSFVQAGVTLITTAVLMIALAALQDLADGVEEETAGGIALSGALAEFWAVSIVQLVGVGLLIAGGVKALGGTGGTLFLVAVGLQIVLCVYWLIRIVTNEGSPLMPLILIVMPIIALAMALSAANKEYVRYKTGRPA